MFMPDSLAKADGLLPDNLIIKVLEEAANGIMITDPGGQILWVNRAMQKLTGYAPNELIGKNPRILKSGKNPPQIYQDLWNTILAGNYWQGELINRKKDGSNYTDFVTITPILDSGGRVANFIAVRQDLTGRKKTEESLKKYSEEIEHKVRERTKQLIDKSLALEEANDKVSQGWLAIQKEKATIAASIGSLPVGFILIDKDKNIVTVNKQALKLLKLKQEIINLADMESIFSINFNLLKLIENARSSKTTLDIKEAQMANKYLHISIVPIIADYKKESEFIGTVILIGDITERKLIERSRDEFFSIASHELRTPLTAIRGNVKLIIDMYKDRIPDPDFHEMLSDIHDSSVRLISIVNDFLNTSRLEIGNIEFKKEIVNLRELIRIVYQEHKDQTAKKGLSFNVNLPENENQEVVADSERTK